MTDDTPATDRLLYVAASTAISAVRTIHIYESTLKKVEASHKESTQLSSSAEAIVDTFSQPTAVYDGNRPGKTYVFVSERNTFEGHPMVATASVVEGTSARWTTTYFSSAFSGRVPIWEET